MVEERHVRAGRLEVAVRLSGPADGWPVVLLHGFPYGPGIHDAAARRLADAGARVVVPALRGFGGTRFVSAETPRSGEQAALGDDLLALITALGLERPILAGHDWGGRAACVVAALWPERVGGLVSQNGCNIQDIAQAGTPDAPIAERGHWYQYYFHSERGRRGLAANRRALCRLLWTLWSPGWAFEETAFEAVAAGFENPDFVEVVIHSYRHRYGLVAGDPAVAAIEAALAARPNIAVPAITLDGDRGELMPDGPGDGDPDRFTGPHEHRVLRGVGHNLPQEAPEAFARAVLDLHAAAA